MALTTPKNMLSSEVALTTNTNILNGAHIIYIYSEKEKYIDNAVSFISAGLTLGHGVLFIDDKNAFADIMERLTRKGFAKEQIQSIIFSDSYEFYRANEVLDAKSIITTFASAIEPLIKEGIPIRTWGKVKWLNGQSCLVEKLKEYEIVSDQFVNEMNSFTVCAYEGEELSANTYIELMKCHQYVMTDTEFTVSSFYENEKLYPSITMEENYEKTLSNLKKIQTHYTHLIEEMPDAAFITSQEMIVYTNKSGLKLLECDLNEIKGKSFWNLIPSQYQQEMVERMNKLKRKEKLTPCELKVRSFSGAIVDIETLSFPFVFEDFKDTVITITRDLKERKENQELVVRHEKLAVTSQLAASIAHEIRNPLTTIKGFMKLGKQEALDVDIYSIVDKEIDRIETIASELLVLGKPVASKEKKSNVGEIIQSVCTLMKSQANMENVMIHTEAVEDGHIILCNEDQIKQVFINIIKNAIEAQQGGGIINIQVSREKEHAIIKIADKGKGIPDHLKKRLGEPFYTTKEKGTGLGLMVCYNIIDQHNGQIEFSSKNGEGTTFTIKLPLLLCRINDHVYTKAKRL